MLYIADRSNGASKAKGNKEMAITTKTNEELIVDLNKLDSTAKKIRFAVAHYKSINRDKPLWDAYKLLQTANVTTKNGTEIRYQHIRNTMMQLVK